MSSTPAFRPRKFFRSLLALLAIGLLAPAAWSQPLSSITDRDGGDGGLVVLLNPGATGLATELAKTQRHLVLALHTDRDRTKAQAQAFRDAEVYPIAHARQWLEPGVLPFQSHTVNVLILDQATANRLGENEIKRVLAPGHGFALVDGTELRKPRSEDMDVWLGWNKGPTGNRMSNDTVLQPVNSIRWLTGPRTGGQHIATDRVHYIEAAFSPGRYHYDAIYGRMPFVGHARDAFSGVHLWKQRYDGDPTLLPWNNINFSDGKRLFLPADGAGRARRGQPPEHVEMQMRDVRSGEVLADRLPNIQWAQRIRAGEIRTGDWGMAFSWYHRLISDGTRIYQADGGHTVRALSADGSRVIWEKSVQDDGYADMVATDGNVLAVVISSTDNFPAPSFRNFNRNANLAKLIVGLDPATGEERWRYEGVEGYPLAFLIVDHGVVAAASHLIGPRHTSERATSMRSTPQVADSSFLVSLDAATGREHFRRAGGRAFSELNNRGDRAGLNVRADRIIFNESMYAYSYDIRTGDLLGEVDWSTRFTGWSATTRNFLLNGTRFISHDGQVDEESGISHSDYGSFNRPANGALYIAGGFRTTSNRRSVGETMALAHEARFPEVIPDDRRLLVRGRAEGVRAAAPEDWPTFRGDFARRAWRAADGPATLSPAWQVQIENLPVSQDGDLRYDWEQNSDSPGVISQAVADGQRVVISIPDTHELVCLALTDGRQLWRTRLSGRTTAPPTLAGDVAFVGLNDGTVSAINLSDGSVIWTFLAAPYERYHNAHQQIESTHPVRSSPVLHNGVLYVAAGRHGRSDNGIFVWALDPATGQPRQRSVITAQHVNDLIQLVGDRLWIAYTALDPTTLAGSERDRSTRRVIVPDETGHDGGMGWTGPYLLWRGYRVHGADGSMQRAGPAIQTDSAFWRFIASAFAEMPFDDVGNHRTVIRTDEQHFADRRGPRSMQTFLAGAGRHQYAVTRAAGNIRIAVADTEAQTQRTYNFEIAQGRELVIPDSIAIAHGHLILTTTTGRVLAFRAE